MKYKKTMKKRVFRLTESQIDRLSKRLLKESYLGIIMPEDTMCEIICKLKLAKYGSKGDVVKMIQHLLYANQFNVKYSGGGMKGDWCYKDWRRCDGLFKNHTEDAVRDFQDYAGIKVDGIVGYNTWKAMCEKLTFTDSLPKDKFCQDCPCDDYQEDWDKDIDVYDPINVTDDMSCEEIKYCMEKYLFLSPVPDYSGFMECVYNNAMKNKPKQDECGDCPKTIDCMPGPGKDMGRCNSNYIKKCIADGCTKVTY
jgi:hypothetical protein